RGRTSEHQFGEDDAGPTAGRGDGGARVERVLQEAGGDWVERQRAVLGEVVGTHVLDDDVGRLGRVEVAARVRRHQLVVRRHDRRVVHAGRGHAVLVEVGEERRALDELEARPAVPAGELGEGAAL